jgi:hypothetical protein
MEQLILSPEVVALLKLADRLRRLAHNVRVSSKGFDGQISERLEVAVVGAMASLDQDITANGYAWPGEEHGVPQPGHQKTDQASHVKVRVKGGKK